MNTEKTHTPSGYESFFEAVPIGLFRTTPGGRILDANPALLRMFGYDRQDAFLRLNASELCVDPEDRLTVSQPGRSHRHRGPVRYTQSPG